MPSVFELVGKFHRKFGLPCVDAVMGPAPSVVTDEVFLFRYQFLQEELQELLKAHRERDLPGIADALVDLAYVAFGTAHMYGIPFDELFEAVHQANMKKVRSNGSGDPRSKRSSGLDVVKPAGWTPPELEEILKSFGWAGPENGD